MLAPNTKRAVQKPDSARTNENGQPGHLGRLNMVVNVSPVQATRMVLRARPDGMHEGLILRCY